MAIVIPINQPKRLVLITGSASLSKETIFKSAARKNKLKAIHR